MPAKLWSLKKSLVDGGLGCVCFMTSLKLLLKHGWLVVFLSYESLMLFAADCVVAMDVKLPVVFGVLVALEKP